MSTVKSVTTTTTAPRAAPPATEVEAPKGVRRHRQGLKRLKFQVPTKMPLPVKALWQGASAEEQARAHRTATAILATWLGKGSREAAAKELGLSAVRLWQLSQQAVCGLVVGCLRQPRFRGRPPQDGYGLVGEGVGALRKRIADLERELDGSRRLVAVMKDLPGNRDRALDTGSATSHGQVGRRRRGAGAAGADDGVAAPPGGVEAAGGART